MHRHQYKGRKLKRDKGHRDLMLRNLATSVLLHEKVKTTLAKAKEIKPVVEKLITKAKKGDVNAIRALNAFLLDKNAAQKTITELGPLYKDRNGGYTRIIKLGPRSSDAAPMAVIELLDVEKLAKKVKKAEKKEENVEAKKTVKKEVKEKSKQVSKK